MNDYIKKYRENAAELRDESNDIRSRAADWRGGGLTSEELQTAMEEEYRAQVEKLTLGSLLGGFGRSFFGPVKPRMPTYAETMSENKNRIFTSFDLGEEDTEVTIEPKKLSIQEMTRAQRRAQIEQMVEQDVARRLREENLADYWYASHKTSGQQEHGVHKHIYNVAQILEATLAYGTLHLVETVSVRPRTLLRKAEEALALLYPDHDRSVVGCTNEDVSDMPRLGPATNKLHDERNYSSIFARKIARYLTGFDEYTDEELKALRFLDSVTFFTRSDSVIIKLFVRPTDIQREENGVIHCADDYAVKFADGKGIYMWQNQLVEERWVKNPETVTAEEIMMLRNNDLRTTALDIIGWGAILSTCYTRTIDKDDDPMIGELIEIVLEDPNVRRDIESQINFEPGGLGGLSQRNNGPNRELNTEHIFLGKRQRLLRAQCGTGRTVVVPVPNTMQTALEANADSYGFSADDFKIPEERT